MPVCVCQFLWYFSACVSGSFSGVVSDSVSSSLAMLLLVSLPGFLALSLGVGLLVSGRAFTSIFWWTLWLCVSLSLTKPLPASRVLATRFSGFTGQCLTQYL